MVCSLMDILIQEQLGNKRVITHNAVGAEAICTVVKTGM